MIEMCTVM